MAQVFNGARLWRAFVFCACAAAVFSLPQAVAQSALARLSLLASNAPAVHRNFSSPQAYNQSVEPARQRLSRLIGAVDSRAAGEPVVEKVAETSDYEVLAIRWPAFERVHGEGLWLKGKKRPQALVVAIPDAEQTPEMVAGLALGIKPELQFARRLAENGCDVLVPVLLREGNPREGVCREALEAGRHIIGYEVEKVFAAMDFLKKAYPTVPLAAVGYGEGGLIAFYAAALDTRIEAALVCGYFDSQRPWELRDDDAEVAALVAPRALLVEYSAGPALWKKRGTVVPNYEAMLAEFERAQASVKEGGKAFGHFTFVCGNEGMLTGPAGELALTGLLRELGVSAELKDPGPAPEDTRKNFDPDERQKRQSTELLEHSRQLIFWRQAPPLWRYSIDW